MSTKIKALFLAAFLVISIGLKAQENANTNISYEYAIVQATATGKIETYTNNNVETTETPKNTRLNSALIQKVEELNKQGWIVFSIGSPNGWTVFYLRRKLK